MSDKKNEDNPGVIMFPPLLYTLALALGVLISFLFPYKFLSNTIAVSFGFILSIIGVVLLFNAARAFVKSKTNVDPRRSTFLIISHGIYRFTRNPMYLGFTLIFIGISFLTSSWFSFILIIPLLIIVQRGIVEREEKYLEKKFGKEYINYKVKVRRWL